MLTLRVLKGHGFSRAVHGFYFCHSEQTLVCEESAFAPYSAVSLALCTSLRAREFAKRLTAGCDDLESCVDAVPQGRQIIAQRFRGRYETRFDFSEVEQKS
jgi:hypothetical protein